jgi:cytidyltransferase-like protein
MMIGRFQPFHIGHYSILKRALEECCVVVVLLGSAQESRLSHNPMSAAERQSLIEDCFPEDRNRLFFISVEDRPTVSNDKSWGEYLFDIMKSRYRVVPEVVYEGKELVRKDWYDTLDVDIIQLSRKTLPISATQLRKMILAGDNNWRHYCPNGAEPHYEKLKEILKDVTKDKSAY